MISPNVVLRLLVLQAVDIITVYLLGDFIQLGEAITFRFNHPKEALKLKQVLASKYVYIHLQ